MDISSPALPTVESVSKATRKRKGSSSSEDGLRKKKKGRQEDVKTTSEIDSELDIELPVGDCLFEFWERTKESMIALRWIRDEDLVRSQASQCEYRETSLMRGNIMLTLTIDSD